MQEEDARHKRNKKHLPFKLHVITKEVGKITRTIIGIEGEPEKLEASDGAEYIVINGTIRKSKGSANSRLPSKLRRQLRNKLKGKLT